MSDGRASRAVLAMRASASATAACARSRRSTSPAQRGRIHAVLGENGAGKSTLIKIMAGVVQPDEGRMSLDGQQVALRLARSRRTRAGIVCIFQELSLMPDLSVADNICITDPPRRFGLIDQRAQRRRAEELLARVGCEDVHPLRAGAATCRCRAARWSRSPRRSAATRSILILDEATSALTAADVEKVYAILKRLRNEGLAILYISHRMHEIEALADTCSVFRNGRHIETFAKGAQERRRDRPADDRPRVQPRLPAQAGARAERRRRCWRCAASALGRPAARHLAHRRQGEIVGLGGLDGQGQRELLLALFGVLRGVERQVRIDGRPVAHQQPARGEVRRARHGADPRGPQDRGADAADVGRATTSPWPRSAQLTRGLVVDRAARGEARSTRWSTSSGSRSATSAIRSRRSRAATSRRW